MKDGSREEYSIKRNCFGNNNNPPVYPFVLQVPTSQKAYHVAVAITPIAAFFALFAAAVLSLGHLLELPVPCGGSRGCAAIAAHPASRILGIPIAHFGVGFYLIIIFLISQAATSRLAKRAAVLLTGIGTVVSAILLIYSQTVIRATCPWCIASGVAMTLLFVLTTLMLRSKQPIAPLRPSWLLVLALITSTAVGVQAGMMQRAANSPPIPRERLANVAANELVDSAKSIGPADAPVTIVMFTDFWCPACRSAHEPLVKYQQTNPNAVRLVFRHLPLLNIRGHELSGAAAALSEIAAEHDQFWPFVNDVFQHRVMMQRDDYLRLMSDLGIDTADLESRIANPDDPSVVAVQRDMDLADKLGVNSTPTFIVMLQGHPPLSANQRTLPKILNSEPVIVRLLQAAAANKAAQKDEKPMDGDKGSMEVSE
jgi:protein-disulfide isomerase